MKSPGLAAVLSFFFGGLGQIYNGRMGKGPAEQVCRALADDLAPKDDRALDEATRQKAKWDLVRILREIEPVRPNDRTVSELLRRFQRS